MKKVLDKEVSCRAFYATLNYARIKNIPYEKLLNGIPYSLSHILNKHERVEYWVWIQFVSNARLFFSTDEFEEMGVQFVKNGSYAEAIFVGSFLISTNIISRGLKRLVFTLMNTMFSCIEPNVEYLTKSNIKLQLNLKQGYLFLPEFFLITKGTIKQISELSGHKNTKVKLQLSPPNAILDISWEKANFNYKVRRQLAWLFNFKKAFLEMTEAHEELRTQYNKLEESKRLLIKQTTQLKTAHSLSTSVHQSLEMSDTLNAIIEILEKEAEFDSVTINILTDYENNQINLSVKSNNEIKNAYKIINDIVVNDKMIGELIVSLQPSKDYLECKELLEYLMPVINIVIHDALVLRAIIDYRNNLEQKVESRTLELEKAKDELSNSNTLLKSAQKIQNNFFANISHEFRTPLTLILGPIKQLIDTANNSNTTEQLNLIYRSAKKLNRLVDELLDISKIESGEMKLNAVPVNLVVVVNEICISFYPLAERKKINFKVHIEEKIIIVFIDRNKFEKILNNVLSNAFKFTPEGGSVEVEVQNHPELVSGSYVDIEKLNRVQLDSNVEIFVRDTGIGIPPDHLDKIFDRFYQVDGSNTRPQEGTGIGLALTKELIELHKGKIEVESEEGQGSIFKLYFPLGKDHLNPNEICEVEPEKEQETVSVLFDEFVERKDEPKNDIKLSEKMELPSLLIVEDNSDVRTYITKILGKNYNICEATDGENGFDKSIDKIPDLIISDIMMPKLDGFKLCNRLKNDARTSHIPIIMLTAKATLDDKLNGLEFGADDYIMKPFEASELKTRIKNLLEQRKRLHEHYYKNGFVNFDYDKITSQDQMFLKKLSSTIIENISDSSFSVELLAESLAVSKSLLLKKTEALTGESPIELIKRIRLTKAAKLIENNFGNVTQVGLEVGFNNPSYFAECFKKQFGVAPSQYSKTKS